MNNYTTKTASLLATKIKGTKADVRKIDTKKLNIDGNPFSKVVSDNVPESPTENDIWKYAVTTDDNGIVTITDDVTVDYTEITEVQKDILKTTVKVIDNKVLDANDVVLMNWDTKNFTSDEALGRLDYETLILQNIFGTKINMSTGESSYAPITEWNSDLSSLTNGEGMFIYCSALTSFSGDLSNLTAGNSMFYRSALKSFNGDLSSLTNGIGMFYRTALESFSGDLSSLTSGSLMFGLTALTSWNIDLPNLTDGTKMFYNTSFTSWNIDLPSLTNGKEMFFNTSLTSFSNDMPSLTNGEYMFSRTPLESFSSNLPSLTDGSSMFSHTSLTSWNIDLPSLTNGGSMFGYSALASFIGDLSSLTYGSHMFNNTALQSFSGDLSNMTNGYYMFYMTALQSFSGDLSNLVYGWGMFRRNQPRHYGVKHNKIVDGVKTSVTETFVSNGLKSFISNLSSLKCGYYIFGSGDNVTYTYTDDSGSEITETTTDVVPLNEESIMLIAETINDISSLDKTVASNWTYADYSALGKLTTYTISSEQRGVLHLGYDATTITDTSKIMKYCDKIANKGWTVYLNGSLQTANNGAIETISLTDENGSPVVIPYYYKPVQVTDEEIAEYVDSNGNYYIIVGAQHIFGDAISTYGMFTSYEHAITEITTGLGLTKYEKPSTETTNN